MCKMIKYFKELINYYKKFGLTKDIYKISIDNFDGYIKLIKHPNNRITKRDVFNSIRFNPVPKETFKIVSTIRKVSNDK